MENKNIIGFDVHNNLNKIYNEFLSNYPDKSKISKEDIDELINQLEGYLKTMCNKIQIHYLTNSIFGLEFERLHDCPRNLKCPDGSPLKCSNCLYFVTVKRDKEEITLYDAFDAYCLKGENE